jgi:hypothetical protein
MYVCDALGYLSSVVVLMIRNFADADIEWANFYVLLCAIMTFTGVICMSASGAYYSWKYKKVKARRDTSESSMPKYTQLE